MIATIICSLIAAAAGITVAVIEQRAAKDRQRTEKRAERGARAWRRMTLTCEIASIVCALIAARN